MGDSRQRSGSSGSNNWTLRILKIDRLDFVVQGVANIHEVDASADRFSYQRRKLAVEIAQVERLLLWFLFDLKHLGFPFGLIRFRPASVQRLALL
jgi:hypothetical protein